MEMVHSSREACAIEMPDYMVLTGGAHDTLNKVSVYSEQGWVRDLPNLIWGRAEHACGHYVQNDIVVSAMCQKVYNLRLRATTSISCNRMLVARCTS